jgi:predicted HTH domain antitoxin
LAISFNDSIITEGLKTSLMVDAYKQGLLSLGQVAKALEMPKEKVMKILSVMGIDVIDYDFKDDLKSMRTFL